MGNCYGKPLFRRSRTRKNAASTSTSGATVAARPLPPPPASSTSRPLPSAPVSSTSRPLPSAPVSSASRPLPPPPASSTSRPLPSASASSASRPLPPPPASSASRPLPPPPASSASRPLPPPPASSASRPLPPPPASSASRPEPASSATSSLASSSATSSPGSSAKTGSAAPSAGAVSTAVKRDIAKIRLNDPIVALTTPTTWPDGSILRSVAMPTPCGYGASVDLRLAQRYKIQEQLGEGSYGVVWKAVNIKTGGAIAVKQIKDAFLSALDAQMALREAVFLRSFGVHPHITSLHDIVIAANGLDMYMVMDLMDIDLHTAIYHRNLLDIHHRVIASQLLQALKFLHSRSVAHRDLKPNNVLINEAGIVKLCDFGLARCLAQPADRTAAKFSSYIINRSYRPPEIELGCSSYTTTTDMWGLGCIIAEMTNRRRLFQAYNSHDHLWSIVCALAPLNAQDIAAVENGVKIKQMIVDANRLHRTKSHPLGLEQLLAGTPARDLIKKLLVFDPAIRWSAAAALSHPFVAMVDPGKQPIAPRGRFNVPLLVDGTTHTIAEYRSEVYRLQAEIGGCRPLPELPTAASGRPLPRIPTAMKYGRPLPPIPVGGRKRKRRPL